MDLIVDDRGGESPMALETFWRALDWTGLEGMTIRTRRSEAFEDLAREAGRFPRLRWLRVSASGGGSSDRLREAFPGARVVVDDAVN